MHRQWLRVGNHYRLLFLFGGLFFIVLVSVSGLLFYATYIGRLEPEMASLGASLILAVLTGSYAFLTLWTMYETRRSRRQEIQPVLEFRPREHGSTIVNIGNGPARDIRLKLTIKPKDDTHRIQLQSLAPRQEIAIFAEPFSSIAAQEYIDLQLQGADIDWNKVEDEEKFLSEFDDYPYERLIMSGSYRDIWGTEHQIDETYDVWNLTETLVRAPPQSNKES